MHGRRMSRRLDYKGLILVDDLTNQVIDVEWYGNQFIFENWVSCLMHLLPNDPVCRQILSHRCSGFLLYIFASFSIL